MANIILIAGTYMGGYYWKNLAESLTAKGHRVFTPTLSGLELDRLPTQAINLDTHVNQVLNLIETNELSEITLVGWSYGGMVITGVGARTKAKVSHLIYLDAPVPRSGEREWDCIPVWLQEKILGELEDGLNIHPSKEFLEYEPRMRPHPIGTKLQPLKFDQVHFDGLPKTYVASVRPGEDSVFASQFARIQVEPNWTFESLPVGHDMYGEAPGEIERIILLALDRR